MFQTVPLSIIRSFSLYTQQYIHFLLTACRQDQDGIGSVLILLASCMTYTITVCTVKNSWWWIHVACYSKNKFKKLVHLVGFIIRIHHDAPSPGRQIHILGMCIKKLCDCHKAPAQKSAALHSNCATAPAMLDHRDDAQSVMWLLVCSGNHVCLANVSYVQLAATIQ